MSEKELGQKWDRCLADAAIKVGLAFAPIQLSPHLFQALSVLSAMVQAGLRTTDPSQQDLWPCPSHTKKTGAGLGLGIVFSVVFFKRRTFPIAFGTGAGLGMAYSNCQNDLRSPYLVHSYATKEQ